MNDFFFRIFGELLAGLFNTEYNDDFRKKANPVQFFGFAIILFFVSLVEKMNKLKCNEKKLKILK